MKNKIKGMNEMKAIDIEQFKVKPVEAVDLSKWRTNIKSSEEKMKIYKKSWIKIWENYPSCNNDY